MFTLYLFPWQCQRLAFNIFVCDSVFITVTVEVKVSLHISSYLFSFQDILPPNTFKVSYDKSENESCEPII